MKNDLSLTQISAETKGSSCSMSIDRISVSREQRLLIMDWIWSKGSIDDKIATTSRSYRRGERHGGACLLLLMLMYFNANGAFLSRKSGFCGIIIEYIHRLTVYATGKVKI